MGHRGRTVTRLLGGVAAAALLAGAGGARAADLALNIAPQPLGDALNEFAVQAKHGVVFAPGLVARKTSRPVTTAATPEIALAQLLEGTGLGYRRNGDTFLIMEADADPQGGSAAGGGAEVEGLIVTAQKREENIQDVPIAMSAFSQETLTERQVAGGPDLITQIPNMSFTKTNFTSYSIQIRGIGTQAISATTDPAVAVAFNNTPFIRNHFFEQEFYDLERLEVLRGPQGTLYGRNATAGVVNIISAKPKFAYDAKLSADLGNYSSTRIEGMVNFPLVEDVIALRLAGAWTKREGYAFNQMTGTQIDGRDLWSTRVSLRFEPTDWISANFIWEHFEEDDDRLRSGKQLCKKNIVTNIGGVTIPNQGGAFGGQTYISQGCEPVSLYSPEAFQTPNGFALPFYGPTGSIGNPVFADIDPYRSSVQSRDLRVIESSVEPDYQVKADTAELQIAIDIGDHLTLNSETSYSADSLWSLQDYNRFTTTPGAFNANYLAGQSNREGIIDANGVFCDPQIGCSDRVLLVDLSTSESTQFSQEFRLGSDFEGPFNFSLGANFLRHDAFDKYYVFINTISMLSAINSNLLADEPYVAGVTDNAACIGVGGAGDIAPYYDPTIVYGVGGCRYIDPNPIGALRDDGRNYFLSKNPYRLISYAAFGEVYYNLTETLKITGGLRFTIDKKRAPQIPSWLLAAYTAGTYPVMMIVDQEWREPTGRLAIDWQPELDFTDSTLVYASYAHGYKAGGANPPPPVVTTYVSVTPQEVLPETFNPEYVDAFEIGTKNTLMGGAVTLNLTGFYYDYKGYQTSEIRNRSAVNSNYDAEVWGAEVELDWRATEALKLGFKGGYNGTRMADGQEAVDLMDRTAGTPGWHVVRPFPTIPSNCILPTSALIANGTFYYHPTTDGIGGSCTIAYHLNLDPVTQLPYDPSITDYTTAPKRNGGVLGPAFANYHGFDPSTAPNNGRGFSKDLSGNELPNAPNYTATVTVDYTMPLRNEWMVTFHGDYHYQSESWARVFNSDPYDRIEGFSTINLAAIFTQEDAGWKVMTYVKNVLDEDAITGAFLNSDDTGLTTNVFLTEPRLYGIRVTKDFTGDGWLGDFAERRQGPYPLTLELSGGTSRFEHDGEAYSPGWLSGYPNTFPMPSFQDYDLDWNDTRNVKLTYAPGNGPWKVSAGYRFGKTSGFQRVQAYQAMPSGYTAQTFYPGTPYEKYIKKVVEAEDLHFRGASRDAEEHTIVDFMVGRDFGMGGLGENLKSVFGLGVRQAEFKSTSEVSMDGRSDSYVQPLRNFDLGDPNLAHSNRYVTSLESRRSFEGVGPTVTWDASLLLFGDAERGHTDLDWSIGGGVLFGKQSAESIEKKFGTYSFGGVTTTLYNNTTTPRSRSADDVTVPNLSLSLGLSYSIDRVKVSTGYSYERFFDAIDAGYEDAQIFDRTIQGPYLKLSLGFGG